MKKGLMNITTLTTILLLSSVNLASTKGAKKHTKTAVTFGFGTYTAEEISKIESDVKRTDSKRKFKGKGIAGKLAGKFFAKSGKSAEILDLRKDNRYELNLKKKKCRVSPIVNVLDSVDTAMSSLKDVTQAWKEENEKYSDLKDSSRIVIKKSVFKVQKTDETKLINNFECYRFWTNAYTQWENTVTGQTGTDSISINSWMTENTEELQEAHAIEMNFNQAYLEKIGIKVDEMRENLFGTKWLEKLKQVEGKDINTTPDYENMAEEIKKFEGHYPIVVDLKYYAVRKSSQKGKMEGGKAVEQEEETITDIRKDAKKKFGGFAKSLFGKKKKKDDKKGLQPIMSLYEETIQFELTEFDPSEFVSPYDCKQK